MSNLLCNSLGPDVIRYRRDSAEMLPDDHDASGSAQVPTYRQAAPASNPLPPSLANDRADLLEHKGYHKKKGHVGPVYTFVKTDYDGNFKWGVRHVAGHQYGRK